MQNTVLLTGASGYIAGHIALQLLDAGHIVRASVRDLSRAQAVKEALIPHLADPANLDDLLTFVALDLDQDTGWDEAMAGVDMVMHTASPFPMVQPKNPDTLIRPAVDGALRALRAAQRAGVRRVILTSSTAAILGEELPDRTPHDETHWTSPEDPRQTAYSISKTLAEKAAWDFVKTDAPEMELTVINPGFVVGPPIGGQYGTSVAVIARILRASDPMLPRIGFTVVDVVDVAAMHLAAMDNPATIGQRIMTVDRFMWFADMAAAIKEALPARKIVTRVAPNIFIRLLGLFDPSVRSILPSLGKQDLTNNARAREVLGRNMRPGPAAIAATAAYLDQAGKA